MKIYPVVCGSCENFFFITDELTLLIEQGIACDRIKAITANFGLPLHDGNIIFLLP